MTSLFPELQLDDALPPTIQPSNGLASYFCANIDPQEIGHVFHLSQSGDVLQAFSAIFHGGQDAALVRLLVLRELAHESHPLSRADINARFAYLLQDTLETILARLRQFQLLQWDHAASIYRVTALARNILAAVESLLNQALTDDADLGFVLSQVAGAHMLGGVSIEQLQHLLGRLLDLTEEFRDAIASGSEFRLKQSQDKWHLACDWVEKGSEILQQITHDPRADEATHRAAQAIGRAQSALLNMQGMFAHALHQVEQQRVHLGESGISTSDVKRWLMNHPDLASLANDAILSSVYPSFITPSEMLDVAETELSLPVDPVLSNELPQGESAPTHAPLESQPFKELNDWLGILQKHESQASTNQLSDILLPANFALASYRASMLPLMNQADEAQLEGATAHIARLSLELNIDDELNLLNDQEIAAMSRAALISPQTQ